MESKYTTAAAKRRSEFQDISHKAWEVERRLHNLQRTIDYMRDQQAAIDIPTVGELAELAVSGLVLEKDIAVFIEWSNGK